MVRKWISGLTGDDRVIRLVFHEATNYYNGVETMTDLTAIDLPSNWDAYDVIDIDAFESTADWQSNAIDWDAITDLFIEGATPGDVADVELTEAVWIATGDLLTIAELQNVNDHHFDLIQEVAADDLC